MIDTHYYYRPQVLDAATYAQFAGDVRRLIAAAQVGLARGEDGTGSPDVSDGRVAFNGDRSHGLDHESFVIERLFRRGRSRGAMCFDFCKTNGKPYDLLVVACLYAFLYRFPNAKFVSDSTLDELRPGFELFTRVVAADAGSEMLLARPIADRELAT